MTFSHVIYLELARLIISWQWVTEVSLTRSIPVILSMTLLSEHRHVAPQVMPCPVQALSSAQDMLLYERMAPVTFRKERSINIFAT
jgi:hypothetical protein